MIFSSLRPENKRGTETKNRQDMEEESNSIEFTPTWVVAAVCFVIVSLSFIAERGLHRLGKILKHRKQEALFEALQKLKEELMLLGFISLLLTASRNAIRLICVPSSITSVMLPCKRHIESQEIYSPQFIVNRRLFSTESSPDHCIRKGMVPLISMEALDHLHIFIFVLAVVHVIFCVTTMVLGGARIRQWKHWEDWVKDPLKNGKGSAMSANPHHHEFFVQHAGGHWRNSTVIGWLISFFKQFYGSVTKSDYVALREGFITKHCPSNRTFDFHNYLMRTLEVDFKKVVAISWYLWLFVVVYLLFNIQGWNTFFWLSFLPLVLLLLVGAKLEHVIARLAQEAEWKKPDKQGSSVDPSDEHFWFRRPLLVLHLIHFILFQNSFEIAFFFWILCTYGYHSCIIEKLGFIITRLIMGVLVQVLCSYSTLPLYVLVTQMGSRFKKGFFEDHVQSSLDDWLEGTRNRGDGSSSGPGTRMNKLDRESYESLEINDKEMVPMKGASRPITSTASAASLS